MTLFPVLRISGSSVSALRVFQYPFPLPCHQASSPLEVLTPSHPTVFHTHHMGPYAALAFCHLASAHVQKILVFQRLNKSPFCGSLFWDSCQNCSSCSLPKLLASASLLRWGFGQDEAAFTTVKCLMMRAALHRALTTL